jgi:hypothetical protein
MIEETCVKPEHLGLYTVVETAKDAIQLLREYNSKYTRYRKLKVDSFLYLTIS